MNAETASWVKDKLETLDTRKVDKEVLNVELKNINDQLGKMDSRLETALNKPHRCLKENIIEDIQDDLKIIRETGNINKTKSLLSVLSVLVVVILAGLGSAYAYGQFQSEMVEKTNTANQRLAKLEKSVEKVPTIIEESCEEATDNQEVIFMLQKLVARQEELRDKLEKKRKH